jgi:hypothetical protein
MVRLGVITDGWPATVSFGAKMGFMGGFSGI